MQSAVVLYLNPGPGANVSVADTIELAKMDRIAYVKESSRDLTRVSRLIAEIELAGHAKYFTTMQMLLITLELGGSGVTLPPPAAMLANKLIKAYIAGDVREAARLQLQFALFPARWMHNGLTPTMKAALKIIGVSAGDPYPPYSPVTGKEYQDLADYINKTDLEIKGPRG